jgi:hypothetical protein
MIASSGTALLPLHFGKVPQFYLERISKLGEAIVESVVQEYGPNEVLTRFSDPLWFQSLAAACSFQFNSSGVTSVMLGSLRRRINARSKELGLFIAGGKGRHGYQIPIQIEQYADKTGLNGTELIRACDLSRRVDSNCVQDSYNLYQQWFLVSSDGGWCALNQGMNTDTRRARRYHWRSENVRDFCSDPHAAIVGPGGGQILNLADARAESTRNHIVDLTQDNPSNVIDAARGIDFGNYHEVRESDVNLKRLGAVLAMAHGNEISSFENLVSLKGVGSKTLKSLALVSEVIHGDASRFEDPARFAFCFGGKDSNPVPTDMQTFDETIQHLQSAVESSKLGYKDKSKALKRLHRATKHVEDTKSPEADIEAYAKSEWDRLEKDGGYTFMGKVIPGVTKAIMGLQNALLYGKSGDGDDKKSS